MIEAISWDGSVISLSACRSSQDCVGLFWTESEGYQSIDLPQGVSLVSAETISRNNNAIDIVLSNEQGKREAAIWTMSNGLKRTPNGEFGELIHLSDDGSVATLAETGLLTDPLTLWTVDENLLPTNISFFHSTLSRDGSKLTGVSELVGVAALYSKKQGLISLLLPGHASGSRTPSISGDGNSVVGTSCSGSECKAVRWTAFGGVAVLEGIPSDSFVYTATDNGWNHTTFDGSKIVGSSGDGTSRKDAVVWSIDTIFQDSFEGDP
jgi:hypothetical protein